MNRTENMELRPIVAVLILTSIVTVYSCSQPCEKDACYTVRCAKPVCKANEIYVPYGGYCGCCDACYRLLSKYSYTSGYNSWYTEY